MRLRDIEARKARLREYYRRAMAREPGVAAGGVPAVRVMLQSYDGSERWARIVDDHLARHWPGEFAGAARPEVKV